MEEACKFNTRLEVLSALQALYTQLYGPLPDLQPAEEDPELKVLSGVNRVSAAGLSYVEAAQLEYQRAEERARRNNKGFLQQVAMILNTGSSPRRAAAAAAFRDSPSKGSPKKARSSSGMCSSGVS